MAGTLLRKRDAGHHAEVTFVELFFDLIFVFAITQVSHSLIEHLTWLGSLQALLLLMAVWWAWVYTAWITNWLDPEHPFVRVMLFVLMAVGLVMSSALPDAFGERGLFFAAAYVAFQLGRTLFALWAMRGEPALFRNFIRVAIWIGGCGILWIAGGLAEGGTRLALWSLALALDYASPALGFWVPGLGRSNTREWNVEGDHIAHRCGLFIMLCLGESILVTGAAFSDLEWTGQVVAAFAVALTGSIAMWWIYFGRHAQAAIDAIGRSDDPGRMARAAFTYIPILIVAGIVISAVGDELTLAHPGGHVEPAAAWVLIGGPALFLLGMILFKFSIFRIWSPARVVGLALMAALIPLADWASPLGVAAGATAILVLVGIWETIWLMRGGGRPTR
jgi:low temperature requirement protein LtrA